MTRTTSPARAPISAAAKTDPMGQVNPLPASLERKVGLLRADLEANGYAVARGYWTLWGVDDCKYPIQLLGYCYGNNPTAPYVLAMLPQWKDEYVDQSLHHALNEPQRNTSATFRMAQREALVILAEMPPPAKYFGIQSNVYSRQIPFNPNDPILPRVSGDPLLQGILFGGAPDPLRRIMVASIGNSTNDVVIERQSGQGWGKERFFVITPDAGMASAMTDALVQAGVPSANDVFVEPVAPALVRVGLDRADDDLLTYIRYALPADPAAGDRWRQELPLTILRVRDMSSTRAPNPVPIPTYETRAWNFDETTLTPAFAALVNAVRTYWDQPGADALPFFSAYKFLDLIGQHCLGHPDPTRGPMDCLGDSQDADYQISQSVHIDDGQVIALVGTLATETGNATYASLSVNWFPMLVGVKNIDDAQLDGSAARFAGELGSAARYFYVYYAARDCSGLDHCVEIPRTLVPTGDILKFIQRNYINPGTHSGPDPAKILNPVAIVLDGHHRPTTP